MTSATRQRRKRSTKSSTLHSEHLEPRQLFAAVADGVSKEIAEHASEQATHSLTEEVATVFDSKGTVAAGAKGQSAASESKGFGGGSSSIDHGIDSRLFETLPKSDLFRSIGELERLNNGLEEAFAFPDLKEGLPGQPSGPTVEGLEQLVWGGGRSEVDLRLGSDFSARGAVGDQHSNGAEPRGRGIGSDPRVGQCTSELVEVVEQVAITAGGVFFGGAACFTPETTFSKAACVYAIATIPSRAEAVGRSIDELRDCERRNPPPPRARCVPGDIYPVPGVGCDPTPPEWNGDERMCVPGAGSPAADGDGATCEPVMSVPPGDTPDSGADSSGNDSQSSSSSSDSGNDSQSNASGSEQSDGTDSCQTESSEECNRATNDDTDDTDESTTHSQSEEREREEGRSNDSQDNQKGGKGCPPRGGDYDDYVNDSKLTNPGSGSEPGGPHPFDQERVGQGNPEEHNHSGITPIEAGTRRGTRLTTLDVTGQPSEAPTRSLTGRTFSLDPVVNPGKHF